MMKWSGRTAEAAYAVGIDIGTAAVKAVRLKFSKSGIELCGLRLEPIASDLLAVLKDIAESLEAKKINLSISGSASIIRYVNFPKLSETELKASLQFEAQKHIPFETSEVNLDCHILKDSLPDNKMFVLLAAAKKDFINQRLRLIEEAGLKVKLVDIDSLAMINAFNFNYPNHSLAQENKAVALLNIGASTSNLDILENGSPALSRDIPIAGNNFTHRIKDTLGIEFKAAEELKLKADKENLDKVLTAVEPALSNLAVEIRTSFDYYETQTASSVVKVFLSGAGSLLVDLKNRLASLLGIEIEHWDPLEKISVSTNLDGSFVKSVSRQLAVATGVALRR